MILRMLSKKSQAVARLDADCREIQNPSGSQCLHSLYEEVDEGANFGGQVSVVREYGVYGCTGRFYRKLLKQWDEIALFEFIGNDPGGNHDDPESCQGGAAQQHQTIDVQSA